jgi:transmembrane sensor
MGQEAHSIDGQAAQWIDRMSRPVIDSDTAAAFDRWIMTDPRHIDSYARMRAIWQSNGLERSLGEAAQAFDASNDDDAEPGRGWRWLARSGVAASLFALGCVGAAQLLVSDASYATATGRTRTVALADGSTIRMHGDTRIRVRIAPWSRHVTLERGEAFFDVAHERLRGFSVDAGGASVSVLGTAFDIDRIDSDTRIIQVYRGLISVDAGTGRQWQLPAGSGLELSGEQVRSLKGIAGDRPGWTDGWLEANDMPMLQLVERLNRIADRPVRLADPALGDLLVTGRFQTHDPKDTLEAITAIHDLHWHDAGDHYVVER